jgi:hypothetical protein
MGQQCTVQSLVDEGFTRLHVYCWHHPCHHFGEIAITSLPPAALALCLDDLPLICTECGNRSRDNPEVTVRMDIREHYTMCRRHAKQGEFADPPTPWRKYEPPQAPIDPTLADALRRGEYP